ncbi:MAG: cation:proton antiporter [Phycisphaerales bacterium]
MPAPLAILAASGHELPLLTTLAAGFVAAWILGLITQRLGLSPIVGYLLAGVVIGPKTPGFVGDPALAHQLAELGVILLMFGVGLHFHLRDLWAVRAIAIPGALGQSLLATLAAAAILALLGWPMRSGVVVGMAMAVASTVVLLRVLADRNLLSSSHGHVAVGWLIVEDLLTVVALVLVPMMAPAPLLADGTPDLAHAGGGLAEIAWALLKLGALVAIMLLAGTRVVPWILEQVAKLRSRELFTLTILVLSVAIAVAAGSLFGASMALGAFLAGLVVGQSPASHQAAADALPMRDAFAVIFFVSVGMLVDPSFVVAQPALVLAGLAVVLVVKPLAAMLIVALCGYPVRTALVVAIGLAQIGEFSFILGQVASDHKLLPPGGMDLLVTVAVISITLNPLAFRTAEPLERMIERIPWLWRLLDARHARRASALVAGAAARAPADAETAARPLAVVVGYGPAGRLVDAMLADSGFRTVVVDMNIDTVQSLARRGREAIYGDAARREVLEHAGLAHAAHLVVTLPHTEGRLGIVQFARAINPGVEITVRARYLAERESLRSAGADAVVVEEGEVGVALARRVLERRGTPPERIERLLLAMRRLWNLQQ